jgi:hypothetical protein
LLLLRQFGPLRHQFAHEARVLGNVVTGGKHHGATLAVGNGGVRQV